MTDAPIGKAIKAAMIWRGDGKKARMAASKTKLDTIPTAVRPTLFGALMASLGNEIDQDQCSSMLRVSAVPDYCRG
jgi:hypothetical protein